MEYYSLWVVLVLGINDNSFDDLTFKDGSGILAKCQLGRW
jgi:hypothetical protein